MEAQGLKVLMISSDRKILESGSSVSERMREYGKLVEELHIVLMSDSFHGLKETSLDKNVWVYPTSSSIHFLRPLGARSLGKKIVVEKKFVRGKSVVTADSIEAGWAGLGIKERLRLPLEVQLHTDPFSPYYSGFQNRIRKSFAKIVLNAADSIRVVSETVGEEVVRRFPSRQGKINILPIYLDRELIEKAQVTFDLHARFGWHFILLAVARLTSEKNLNMALEVLKRVLGYYPDTGLVIVGSGPEEANLKSKTKALGIEKNVAFVGWQKDVASYYKSANLFIQTSNFEGYGLALVEAGLSGLPVVSTSVGIANDLENGKELFVCPPNDPEYMFKAVYDLMENNQKRESLKINMKNALSSKLISKEEYLNRLSKAWQDTALRVTP